MTYLTIRSTVYFPKVEKSNTLEITVQHKVKDEAASSHGLVCSPYA